MAKLINLSGKQFGKLTVIEYAGKRQRPGGSFSYDWRCRCECGNEFIADGNCIRRGSATSCGCDNSEKLCDHGMSKPEHPQHWAWIVWSGMRRRCYTVSDSAYNRYGGRGIKICDAWLESVRQFYADMGDRPTPKHTIERIDNNGNYEPGNCVWATRAEQTENQRSTKLLTFQGESLSISKWARRLGISRRTLSRRIASGWTVEQALHTNPEINAEILERQEAAER